MIGHVDRIEADGFRGFDDFSQVEPRPPAPPSQVVEAMCAPRPVARGSRTQEGRPFQKL
jgi:hypothetical protein